MRAPQLRDPMENAVTEHQIFGKRRTRLNADRQAEKDRRGRNRDKAKCNFEARIKAKTEELIP